MGKYVTGFVFLFMMMSCGEDVEIFIPRNEPIVDGDISRLTSKLKQDIAGDITTTISCPCFGDQAYEFGKDLVLVIPPEFVDISQYPCVNGTYDLTVTICDEKVEIMTYGIPTMSENKLLESRLEFKIEIKNGGQHVALAHGKQIRVLINDPDPRDRMELFYGSHDGKSWIQADGNPETWDNVGTADWWIQIDSTGGNPPIEGFGYEAFSDSLDWINVDVFHDVPASQRTAVCVQLPQEFSNTNAQVFMVFQDYNSVVYLPGDEELKQFCESYGATPIGYRVTFVVIGERGEGNYYFATKDATISEGMVEIMTPKRTPYEEIKEFILQL